MNFSKHSIPNEDSNFFLISILCKSKQQHIIHTGNGGGGGGGGDIIKLIVYSKYLDNV